MVFYGGVMLKILTDTHITQTQKKAIRTAIAYASKNDIDLRTTPVIVGRFAVLHDRVRWTYRDDYGRLQSTFTKYTVTQGQR